MTNQPMKCYSCVVQQIPLRARDGSIRAYAIVDDEDFERLSRHKWHLDTEGYAESCIRKPEGGHWAIKMPRMILGLEPGDRREADHKDRNRLNNRRSNLRITTHAENQQNRGSQGSKTYSGKPTSSQFRGVTWNKNAGKWMAQAYVEGCRYYLGLFDSEVEAAQTSAEARLALMSHTIEHKGRVAMARSYKIRSFRNGANKSGEAFVNYSVTIPTPVAEKILQDYPDGVEFEVELTEEGILYRPVEPRTDVPTKLPFKRGARSTNGDAPPKPAAKVKPGPKPKAGVKPKVAPRPKAPGAKVAPKPAAKRGPSPKVTPRPAPRAKAATTPRPTVRKPAAKATTAKPGPKPKVGAPKPRAPRPKA